MEEIVECQKREIAGLRHRLELAEKGEAQAMKEVHRLREIEVRYNNLCSLKARLIDMISREPFPPEKQHCPHKEMR